MINFRFLKKLFLFVPFFVILIDQFFKYKIRHFGGFYVCNKGIAFGININSFVFWLIIGLFFIFLFIKLKNFYKKQYYSTVFLISLFLFISGAFSNLLDRLFFGCVFDYIIVFEKTLPVFNIADMEIFISVGMFFFFIFQKTTTPSE